MRTLRVRNSDNDLSLKLKSTPRRERRIHPGRALRITLIIGLSALSSTAGTLDIGLIAHYGLGANANDSSGNGHDGTEAGVLPAPGRFGTPNSAFRFNGID